MITRDNETTLPSALASVAPWADELVVVDTGSKDGTIDIARSFGARVFEFTWCDDFGEARNAALSHCRGEWVFHLDSDETLDSASGPPLRTLVESSGDPIVRGYFLNYSPRGDVSDRIRTSLLRRSVTWEGRIHEMACLNMFNADGEIQIKDSGLVIHHSGYDDPDLLQRKSARNLRLLRIENDERPNNPRTLYYLSGELLRNGFFVESIGHARRALADPRLEPYRRSDTHETLGESLFMLGRYEEVEEALADWIADCPDRPEPIRGRGFYRIHQGRLREGALDILLALDRGLSAEDRPASRNALAEIQATIGPIAWASVLQAYRDSRPNAAP
jgi:glycosyltransferase involved in cell wall biosynthesis